MKESRAIRTRCPEGGVGRGVTASVKRGGDAPILFVMLQAEDWNIAVKVYAGDPISALLLAYQLIAIKQALQRGRKGISDAIEGLDLALESLYPHTDFYRVGHQFYYRTIEGVLSPNHEAKLRELGVKL